MLRPLTWLRTGTLAAAFTLAFTLTPAAPAAAEEDFSDPNLGRLSLDLGVDFASSYFFRGFPQENQGLIAQPWGEVGVNFFDDGEGFIDSLDAYVGVWNSMHTEKTLAESGPSNWYEADFYAGVSVGLFDDFTADILYTGYASPNGAFDSINEAGLVLGYDDSELLGDFAMEPYVGFFFELDSGSSANKYFEVGFGPSFELIESHDAGVGLALSIPVPVGLDMDGYYGDNTFGFFDVGAVVSTPLGFIPGDFGAWEAYAGVHYIRLGNQAAAGGFPDITDGSKDHVYGTFGFSLSY